MDPRVLREATRHEHESVEGSVPLLHQELTLAEYVSVLQRLYGVVKAWEQWLRNHAPSSWQQRVVERERLSLLISDLQYLDAEVPKTKGPSLERLREMADVIGAMYVMEGSTLGAQLIARHIERVLHLTSGRGNSFFGGRGDRTGPMWKEFCSLLESVNEAETPNVIRGARTMFQIFQEWMQYGDTDKT